MNDKTFKTIIGLGLTIVIVLCGFLVFQGFNNSVSANSDVKTTVALPGDDLIEMFNLGLSKTRSDLPEEEMEQYYAMVEAAIQQSSQYPERMGDFWRLFEKHLREIESVSPVSRVAQLDLFVQQVEQCTNHCKSIEQFNQIWQTRKSIMAYRNSLISTEANKALTLLEKVDGSQMSQLLKKEVNEQNQQYAQAYALILEFSDDLPEELSKRLEGIVQKFGAQLMTETEQKLATLKQRFETETGIVKEKEKSKSTQIEPVRITANNSTSSNSSRIEYGTGVTYQLLMDLQGFITNDLNSEVVQLLASVQQERIANIQLQASELFDKTRTLNQIRYNLWANRVIASADRVTQFDQMSLVSVEFLYPAVSALYNEKLGKIMMENKNLSQMSENVHKMILNDKAPLSAF